MSQSAARSFSLFRESNELVARRIEARILEHDEEIDEDLSATSHPCLTRLLS